MRIKDLVELVAEQEGKASEVSVGNIREIIGIVSDILAEEDGEIGRVDTYSNLVKNGKRRSKAKIAKKKK